MGSPTPQTSEDALNLTNTSFDHHLDLLHVSLLCKGYTDHLRLVSVAGLSQEEAKQAAKSEYKRLKTTEDNWKTLVISCNMKAAVPLAAPFRAALKVGFQEGTSILKTGSSFDPAAGFKCSVDATNFAADEILAGAAQQVLKMKKQRLDDKITKAVVSMPPASCNAFQLCTSLKPLLAAALFLLDSVVKEQELC
eukprot:136112-Rhodomonas_salina.1